MADKERDDPPTAAEHEAARQKIEAEETAEAEKQAAREAKREEKS